MLKIYNTRVYGLEESVKASGYPMMSGVIPSYDDDICELSEQDIKRMGRLGNAIPASGHDCFLKGVTVQFDITYPNYWTPQFQRYHFADIVSSTSKMHRITKMNLKEVCNEYVDEIVLKLVSKYVEVYNCLIENNEKECIVLKETNLNLPVVALMPNKDGSYETEENVKTKEQWEKSGIVVTETKYSLYEIYMKIISNAPLGLEQTMRVTTNYLQLKTIYNQRKHHKLKEDWGNFCNWCEELPNFKEMCLGGK